MESTISISIDNELKQKSDKLFEELGTDTTTAIKIFLKQSIADNGFPFEIRRKSTALQPLSEEELLDKLKISRRHLEQGKARDADDVVMEIRGKHGL